MRERVRIVINSHSNKRKKERDSDMPRCNGDLTFLK